jgi:ketosteroid isomerase-like protein
MSVFMSPNKTLVETFLATADRSKVAPLLADDVEWVEWGDGVLATGTRTRGKAAFIANFGDDELRCQITRITEEDNVVVAEGTARVRKKDGGILTVRFCDIFELENGKVKRLNSFGALIKDPAKGGVHAHGPARELRGSDWPKWKETECLESALPTFRNGL